MKPLSYSTVQYSDTHRAVSNRLQTTMGDGQGPVSNCNFGASVESWHCESQHQIMAGPGAGAQTCSDGPSPVQIRAMNGGQIAGILSAWPGLACLYPVELWEVDEL